MFFALLSHWLKDCDTNHDRCRRGDTSVTTLPTRLIDVGHGSGSAADQAVYLRATSTMTLDELEGDVRYIALSHPWGDRRNNNHFCTTHDNYFARTRDGICVDDLPESLGDAVQVTRMLGVRYLWIDTICIIQGPDGDFNTEATRMETVFSLAYCVITASRATGTSSGFLSGRDRRDFVDMPFPFPRRSSSSKMKSSRTHSNDAKDIPTLYICEAIDDFQNDVIEGALNKRGWVLQERALARRTIYFTQTQTYFECGAGVRSETLARMTNNQAAFLGDPNFPAVAVQSSKGARIRLYESLYKTYSALDFTRAYDRPVGIAGLEQRLVRAFNIHGGYGVFDGPFFGRSVLWKRDETVAGNREMRPIVFPPRDRRSFYVPTWSWMAYEGVISFMELPFDGVEWQTGDEEGILSPWAPTTSSNSGHRAGSIDDTDNAVWHTGKSRETAILRARARELALPLSEAQEGMVWDVSGGPLAQNTTEDEAELEIRCVIIGRQKGGRKVGNADTFQHYVLVVGKTQPPAAGDLDKGAVYYQRLGVGSIPGRWIVQDRPGKMILIV